MSGWTDFVTKIYNEQHSKDPNYLYKDAMKDASKRKGEMGSSSSAKTSKKQGKTKKRGGSKKQRKAKKSRKNRK